MSSEVAVDHEELRALVADVLDVEPEAVTDDVSFVDDLGVDSLVALELAVSLERRYRIKIESTDITDVQTMRDVVDLLAAKRARA